MIDVKFEVVSGAQNVEKNVLDFKTHCRKEFELSWLVYAISEHFVLEVAENFLAGNISNMKEWRGSEV